MIGILLAIAIQLTGVTGKDLRARAFFDANNVMVGDPMVLTVDFLGEADFRSLHPPALARHINRKDWKLDDVSARTETYNDARRLTYRVRPMRKGVLWFPALEFEYGDAAGGARRTVRSNEIPVHAKVGAQVVVEEMGEDANAMPQPPGLVTVPSAEWGLSEDELFAWRRACANPKADAFVPFDLPAARLNEAACAIREGNWARAMRIYSRLEWRIGQTKAVEKGLVAALALRYDNPSAELPVWRQVGRPLLRFAWRGRVGIVVGGVAALVLLFWLIGRGIKAVACLAVCLLVMPGDAQGIFEQFERMEREMRQRMRSMTQGFGFGMGERMEREPVRITARATASTAKQQVGDPFRFIVAIEVPRTCSIGQLGLTPSQTFGMKVVGEAENLPDGKSDNPTNVVKRLSVPVRYDVPFKGEVSFTVRGMVSGTQMSRGRNFSFSFQNSFQCETGPVRIDVRPLPSAGQPKDFAGVVSEGLRLMELPDMLTVETNDVIQITYRMQSQNGYVPLEFLPEGAAFEMSRNDRNGQIEYRRFLVADGLEATPKVSVSYYDPRKKCYRQAEAGGTGIRYVPPKQ